MKSTLVIAVRPEPVEGAKRPSTVDRVKRILSATALWTETVQGPAAFDPIDSVGSRVGAHLRKLSVSKGATCFHLPHLLEPAELDALTKEMANAETMVGLSACCALADDASPPMAASESKNALSQVSWQVAGQLPPLLFFQSFSVSGVWNHLQGPNVETAKRIAQTASLHPNIVHSWEGVDGVSEGAAGYGRLPPLPGRPLWHFVSDPVQRLILLSLYGKHWLLRSRVDEVGDRLFTIGDALRYHFSPPEQLPEGHLENICAMVAAGGTVASTHVRTNLERAFLIGYVQEKGVLVANSSLKNPRPGYLETVRQQSGLDLTGYLERGYTSVRPEYRGLGIGTKLLDGLTRRAGDRKIFSVISEDNQATKIIARRNRTRKVATYFSPKTGKPVGIWMPEQRIDR